MWDKRLKKYFSSRWLSILKWTFQKVDPKIINKALDMFDKMKPNDKQKMQQSIGKSYRDLLKTVQRGRV